MAGVIGPSNKLPGHSVGFEIDGRVCDDQHCNDIARHAIIGEADSMGAEIVHLCSKHYLEVQKERQELEQSLQHCDICKQECIGVAPFRDPDEGQSGPIYNACPECRRSLTNAFVVDDDLDDDRSDVIDDGYDINIPEDDDIDYH